MVVNRCDIAEKVDQDNNLEPLSSAECASSEEIDEYVLNLKMQI